MLKRRLTAKLNDWFDNTPRKPLLIKGARQSGKTYIIRHILGNKYENFVEINLVEDAQMNRIFEKVKGVEDFFVKLSLFAGEKLVPHKTLIFIDEIQHYKNTDILTLAKFLFEDGRFDYVFSGSLLGNYLYQVVSLPLGYLHTLTMYPLNFEEFLWANGIDSSLINQIYQVNFLKLIPLEESVHRRFLDLFKKYLVIGGLPEAVNIYLETKNLLRVQEILLDIHRFYLIDISQYAKNKTPYINQIYSLIPSQLGAKKKRLTVSKVKERLPYDKISEDFVWLSAAGVVIPVYQVSIPSAPLIYSQIGSFVKLYLNDPGLLSTIMFGRNSIDIINDKKSINIGSIYENAIACELASREIELCYYDSKKHGEVEFMFTNSGKTILIEVKSGKDYLIHSAFNYVLNNQEYQIDQGYVLCNKNIHQLNGRVYLPVYMATLLPRVEEKEIIIK